MTNKWSARLLFFTGAVCAALAMQQLWNDNLGSGAALGGFSKRSLGLMGLVLAAGLLELAALGLTWTRWLDKPGAWLQKGLGVLPRWLALAGFGLSLAALPLVILSGRVDAFLLGLGMRAWLLWLGVRAGGLLWKAFHRASSYFASILGAGLVSGVVLVALVYLLPSLTVSPFSQGWSEASRFYNASLFAAQPIYGVKLPLPTLHPTRYLLQAAAFLIPDASILVHRIWQVLLWLLCNGFTAWALARRLALPRWQGILAGMWVFLFFFIGPVYYHLVLCAGIIFLVFDRRKPLRSLGWVIGVSIWAGMSRINWFPMPGVVALVLYLLEEVRAGRPLWRYLTWPAAWVLGGTLVAFATNAVYIALSANPPEVFGSALSSPLLWERLFPNVTYPEGILPASAWAFLPVTGLAALKLAADGARWNWLRWLGLAGVLAVFFAGGLVVSVKVGGGSNLHNLDNFIVLLAMVVIYICGQRFAPDTAATQPRRVPILPALLLMVALLPVLQPLGQLKPLPRTRPDEAVEKAYLWRLQKLIDSVKGKGPVLFISDRQLVTFKTLKVDSFEAEYEKVFLMEMAMSGNPSYLGRFSRELEQHKFPLILTEPLNAVIQNQAIHPFAEENNLWVTRVEQLILRYYKVLEGFSEGNLWVYVPR